jgi:chemotaxis protein MotB
MKLSNSRSRRRPERAALAALLLVAPLAAGSGCVTKGEHDRVVGALEAQRNRLEDRVRDLERSNDALGEERVKLLDEMEDLRQTRETLGIEVEELQRTRDELSQNLRQREEKLEELSKLSGNYEQLVKDLESEVSAGQIQIEQLREGLRLNLSQNILFRSGAVALEPYGVEVLKKVSSQLHRFPQTVEVQGHSDDVPLSTSLARRWGTNWELAAARAASVVRLFESEGVDPTRMRAVSYGEHEPVASNDTAEGRAANRRIEIRLIPLDATAAAAEAAREVDAGAGTDARP